MLSISYLTKYGTLLDIPFYGQMRWLFEIITKYYIPPRNSADEVKLKTL